MSGTIEERVAYLEGKVEEHSRAWEDLKDMIIHLDQKVDRRIDALDAKVDRHREELSNRIDALEAKFDNRINALDNRINALDNRINALEAKFDNRIDALDQKFSRYFLWIIGIQVSIFLAIIATLLK
jgi:chromosome segregation ATPase